VEKSIGQGNLGQRGSPPLEREMFENLSVLHPQLSSPAPIIPIT
jgi:hypothetical protein